jgi:hypothetical protein
MWVAYCLVGSSCCRIPWLVCAGGIHVRLSVRQVIPDVNSSTATFLGLPMVPGCNIAVEPERLEGFIDRESGEAGLDFVAKFFFTAAGSVYRVRCFYMTCHCVGLKTLKILNPKFLFTAAGSLYRVCCRYMTCHCVGFKNPKNPEPKIFVHSSWVCLQGALSLHDVCEEMDTSSVLDLCKGQV